MKSWLKTLSFPAAGLGLLCALAGPTGSAFAQTAAPAPAAAPAAPAAPQVLGMDFTGYVDVGIVDFSTGRGQLAAVTPDQKSFANARTFDFANDQPTLQNLSLRLNRAPDAGFGGMVDLTLGQDADTVAAYGTIDKKKGPAGGANQMYDVTQLFAYYGFGKGNVIVGKFATHAGQEVITSRDNTNFSRSILFGFAIPFTHTGLRATIKPTDTLNILVGANEGWDTVTSDNGTTGEFGWEWTPSKAFSFFGTYLNGEQQTGYYPQLSKVKGNRSLVDLIFTYNATDALSFVLNYDNGSQEKVTLLNGKTGTDTWSGTALYVNYGINDNWRTSIRGESFTDSDGYRIPVEIDPNTGSTTKTKGPTWSEGTVTLAYLGLKNTEIRGEFRQDSADQKIFVDSSSSSKPPTNGGTKLKVINSMTSVGLEAIYKF